MSKNRILYTLIGIAAILMISENTAQATAQTLPKNGWNISLSHQDLNIVGGAVLENGNVTYIKTKDFALKHFAHLPEAQALIDNGADPETRLVNDYTASETSFTAAYGFTNTLTLSLIVPYFKRTLNYSDDYIALQTQLNQNAPQVIIPPQTAKADGIGDLTLALKKKLRKTTAIAFSVSANFLKTGKAYSELEKERDGFQELPTGNDHDTYTLAVFQDLNLHKRKFHTMLAYTHYSRGYEDIFEQDFKADPGDILTFSIDTDFPINQKLFLNTKLSYLIIDSDRKKENGVWQKIDHSNGSLLVAELGATYMPTRTLHLSAIYNHLISHETGVGIYESPARLDLENYIKLGISKLFF